MSDANIAAPQIHDANDGQITAITDADFDSTIRNSELPVLVKFEAPWCGPCQAMKPLIREIAADYAGQLTVKALDIDQNSQAAYRAGVRGVPTVILFKGGAVVGQHVGLPRKAQLVALIDRALG